MRDAVAILALCELAAETAAGGDLDDLRSQLAALRLTENPPGIEEAEQAALELQQVLGAPPVARHARAPRRDRRRHAPARGRARRRSPGLAVRRGDEGRERGRRALQREVERLLPASTSGSLQGMEGGGFGFPFGGDPEELLRGIQEFAAQQAESVHEAQREQFATLTLNTAVELTAAALKQVQATGGPDEQAIALRDAMRRALPRGGGARFSAPARASCARR